MCVCVCGVLKGTGWTHVVNPIFENPIDGLEGNENAEEDESFGIHLIPEHGESHQCLKHTVPEVLTNVLRKKKNNNNQGQGSKGAWGSMRVTLEDKGKADTRGRSARCAHRNFDWSKLPKEQLEQGSEDG